MKQIKCEMCGSTDLLKQDGVFVCQSCGCKYTVEEAKKLMVEGVVEVKGEVKIDKKEELNNLYILARRARDASDTEQASELYSQILKQDPQSWEAYFYASYYQWKHLYDKSGDTYSALKNVNNSTIYAIEQIKSSNLTDNERYETVKDIVSKLLYILEKYCWDSEKGVINKKITDTLDANFGFDERYLALSRSLKAQSAYALRIIGYNKTFSKGKYTPSDDKIDKLWELIIGGYSDRFSQVEAIDKLTDYDYYVYITLLNRMIALDREYFLPYLLKATIIEGDAFDYVDKAAKLCGSATEKEIAFTKQIIAKQGLPVAFYKLLYKAIGIDNLTVVKFLLENGCSAYKSFFEYVPIYFRPNGYEIIQCLLKHTDKFVWTRKGQTSYGHKPKPLVFSEKSYYDLIISYCPDAFIKFNKRGR